MHIIFFFCEGLGLYHVVPPGTFSQWHKLCYVVAWWCVSCPLLRMAVAAAVWFYLAEDGASCHYQCGFQGLLLRLGSSSTSFTVAWPTTLQYLPPPPLLSGSRWWVVGLNSQIPSTLLLWSQFTDLGWPQGCIWSYIMLMGGVQGTFSELCWIMGIWGCVGLCGSCRSNKFVKHINPVQETLNWVCCAVFMVVKCNIISYNFFFFSLS